jgi:hypothetical protein
MRQLLKKVFVANLFDNSKTVIPKEGSQFALFRCCSLADVDANGRCTFNPL